MRRLLALALVASCGGSEDRAPDCVSFLQWGRDPTHAGAVCVTGQSLSRSLERMVYDPFAPEETELDAGSLLVHYQVPLIAGDDVYLMFKSGTYTPCARVNGVCSDPYYRNSQVWVEKGFRWEEGRLVEKWMFASDWKSMPALRFEPMFQPAVVGDYIYVPGLGGSVHKLDRRTGVAERRIAPFGTTLDPDTYVAGALAADPDGNIYYTALELDHDDPFSGGADADGWLVRIAPDDQATTRRFQDLVVGAPAPTAMCRTQFTTALQPRPWPPPDVDGQPVYPPEVPCRSQRPGVNAAPAIGADGTIFLVSRAHAASAESFIVALAPDLSPKWARSLNRVLDDGCGVTVPYEGNFGCRPGARQGVDPATNELPAARVQDSSSSTPVALPDGGVLYGAFTSYNGQRGHLLRLDASGQIVATHDFGWDVTPAVYEHDGTYSVVIKDNTYTRDSQGLETGPFLIKQLSKDLELEWMYKNETVREDHPNGYEWCINAPVLDREGTVFGLSEDGHVYAVGQGGVEKGRLFLEMPLGAAYTPLALDKDGRVYAMNYGVLTVVGE